MIVLIVLCIHNGDRYYYRYYYKILLQNATAILLQNSTKVYYKMCHVYYKMSLYKCWYQFNDEQRKLKKLSIDLKK